MTGTLRKGFIFIVATTAVVAFAASDAFAARGASISGSSSLTFGLSLVTADQKDMNSVIDAIGTSYPGNYGVKNLGSAYEFFGQYAFRFSGSMFGLVFRPSYFTQSTDGGCGGSSCSFKMSGFTMFPMLRLTPLENGFIKFFMQAGVGYGQLNADVSEGSAKASFGGSAFGQMAGIGVDFCFTDTHCLTIEGNVRYLPIERNTSSSASGTFSGGFSQINNSGEVEYNGNDLSTTLSGIQGVLAYTLNF